MTYEVGKFYRVPTVQATWHGMVSNWPILGPWHEDSKLVSFDLWHYHFDFRFMNRREWSRQRHDRCHGGILHNYKEKKYGGVVVNEAMNCGPIVMRRRKCHREMPTFPVASSNGVVALPKVYEFHKSDSLGANMQCPHRGVSLESIKPICGVIVCPLHGLCFDAETKKVIDPKLAAKRMGDQRILGSSLK